MDLKSLATKYDMATKTFQLNETFQFLQKSHRKAGDGLRAGLYPFFTSSQLQTKWFDEADYSSEAIILGTGGAPSIHCADNFSTSADTFIIAPKDKNILAKYVYYFLSGNKDILDRGFKGAGLRHLSKEYAEKIQIPFPVDKNGNPDLAEQKRIVATLEEAESLKKKRAEADQKMNELIPALFNKMFGDPADNKMAWNIGVLGDVVHSAKDGPHVSPKYSDSSGIPFFSSRHVKPGEIIWEDLKYIELQEAQKQWKKCRPEKGDILYTKGGTTGVAAVVTFDTPIAVWVHIALLKTNHSKVNSFWLETMLNSAFCYKQSQELTHGIANRDLGLNRMKTIKIFLPPLHLQNKFAEKIKEIKVQKENQRQSGVRLDGLFSSLLSRSFASKT